MTYFNPAHQRDTIHAIERHSDPIGVWAEVSYRTNYRVIVAADIEEDWNAYSKAWHRSYGPKRTTTNRCVEFYSKNRSGEWTLRKTHALDSFRGSFFTKALVDALSIPTGRERGFARRIQLNDMYRIERIADDLYVRTVAGSVYDYVAVKDEEETYHAETEAYARAGLAQKIAEAARIEDAAAKGEMISAQMGKRLGFCENGMREFAHTIGLSYNKAYTADEFAAAIDSAEYKIFNTRGQSVIMTYEDELQKIARLIGREDLMEAWSATRVYA